MEKYSKHIKSRKEEKKMYFNILKKDFKRKKTMNCILLMFTILAAMFVSSGVSNVITVMNGTDYYLDKAGIGDFVVITQNGDGGVQDKLDASKYVDSYKMEKAYWGEKSDLSINGKDLNVKSSTIVIQEICETGITFFDTNNEVLSGSDIKEGEVYVTAGLLNSNEAAVGDTLSIHFHGVDKDLKIAGEVKDALLGSDMMGNTRFLISKEDIKDFDLPELKIYEGRLFNVNSSQIKELRSELSDAQNVLFARERGIIKMSYVMEMIIAMIVLVVSVCLCIVSFVLLKFVITFTINEDFREIGVMKAIGIHNFKIRSIYLTKYLVMSIIGSVIGFFAGLPFGEVLINSVSKKMVLSNDFGIILNVLGAVLVAFIMTGFAYLCTGKIKKSTPVDAIRNGSTGERFSKKNKLSQKRMKGSNAFFMAVNDFVCAPKRFMTIILSFFLCSILVFGIVEVADTMLSDRLITSFGTKSDIYLNGLDELGINLFQEDGEQQLDALLAEVEDDLKDLGMPASTNIEVWYQYKMTFDGTTSATNFLQNRYHKSTDYEYTKGSAPMNANEIAITKQISEETGAVIGDTVTIDLGTQTLDCIVVGYFQTMNQMGNCIRLHEDAPTNMMYACAFNGLQINFDDHPDAKVNAQRIEKLKDFYHTEDVFDAAGYCDDCMKVASTMRSVQYLLLLITGLVVILVTILMEKSFISDETSQMALLKAIGFRDSFIIKWQVYRFLLVAVLAEVLAVIFTYPVTKLWCDPIWSMMGASQVSYYFNPLSLCVIYPGILLVITLVTVWLTAGATKKITSNDVGNVE